MLLFYVSKGAAYLLEIIRPFVLHIDLVSGKGHHGGHAICWISSTTLSQSSSGIATKHYIFVVSSWTAQGQ